MTGLFGGGGAATPAAGSNSTIGGAAPGPGVSSGGFTNDNAKRMPSSTDKVGAENARNKRLGLSAKSGRQSTDLGGTRAYVNSFLGGVQ